MELREVITFALVFMAATLLITMAKMRSNKKTGFISLTNHPMFFLKVGLLKVEGKTQFSIIIENNSDVQINIKDIYLEIKNNGRYQKHQLPKSAFDNSKIMEIPSGKSGAVFLKQKTFFNLFSEDTLFKVAVTDDSGTGKTSKSKIIKLDSKKKNIELK